MTGSFPGSTLLAMAMTSLVLDPDATTLSFTIAIYFPANFLNISLECKAIHLVVGSIIHIYYITSLLFKVDLAFSINVIHLFLPSIFIPHTSAGVLLFSPSCGLR